MAEDTFLKLQVIGLENIEITLKNGDHALPICQLDKVICGQTKKEWEHLKT
jgi:hypothetical protein